MFKKPYFNFQLPERPTKLGDKNGSSIDFLGKIYMYSEKSCQHREFSGGIRDRDTNIVNSNVVEELGILSIPQPWTLYVFIACLGQLINWLITPDLGQPVVWN